MRKYIAEIKTKGLSFKQIAKETGITENLIRDIASGKVKLKSGGAGSNYEKIRNANRRIGYRKAREAGLTPERANEARRTIFNPEKQTTERASIREVKHKAETTRFQTRILGEFKHDKRKEIKISEGFSHAYLEYNKIEQTDEAIKEAQSKLGSSGWQLIRLIEHEVIEYKITGEKGTEEI